MANNIKTAAIKTEFVNLITEGELLTSPVSATFSTIVTKASLIKTPPSDGQISEKTITTLYDKVFVDTISYWAFTKNKLRPWENALEEADILTGRDFILQQEIKTHVSKITKTELYKRLHRPTHFHFKETPLPPFQPTASSLWTLTTYQHPICYTQSGEPMRCYEYNSLSHIK